MNGLLNRQYICENCFSQKDINDVLFCRNAIQKTADYRKQRFWRTLHPGMREPQNTRCFADWRSYPENQRMIQGEAVTGIIDFSGDMLYQKVCPVCHYPISQSCEQTLVMLFWSHNGVDFQFGERFLRLLCADGMPWNLSEELADPDIILMPNLKAISAEGISFMMPTGLVMEDSIVDQGLYNRYIQVSNGAAVLLNLESVGFGGPAFDFEAIDTLLAYSQVNAPRGECTPRPTLVCLRSDDPVPGQNLSLWSYLDEKHHNLLNALNAILINYYVMIWNQENSGAMVGAVNWLVQGSFGIMQDNRS